MAIIMRSRSSLWLAVGHHRRGIVSDVLCSDVDPLPTKAGHRALLHEVRNLKKFARREPSGAGESHHRYKISDRHRH